MSPFPTLGERGLPSNRPDARNCSKYCNDEGVCLSFRHQHQTTPATKTVNAKSGASHTHTEIGTSVAHKNVTSNACPSAGTLAGKSARSVFNRLCCTKGSFTDTVAPDASVVDKVTWITAHRVPNTSTAPMVTSRNEPLGESCTTCRHQE